MEDFTLYIDTDSCDGKSKIYINDEQISIEDYYDSLPNYFIKNEPGDYIKSVNNGDKALSFSSDKNVEYKDVVYIMKHWVKKKMFRIIVEGLSVDITEDHSIIILRDDKLISARPEEIKKDDELICLLGVWVNSRDFIIEDLGIKEQWVYDIEVKDNHNFFANDILIHNSLFLGLDKWFKKHNFDKKFNELDYDKKIQYILKISKYLENLVNTRMYDEMQTEILNSREEEFKINFKQEIIAESALMVMKKKYGCWVKNEEGNNVDKLTVKGLEIIKAETSPEIKSRLKTIMQMILKGAPDEEIKFKIFEYKKELKELPYEDLSVNMGINNIDKYLDGDTVKPKCPWTVKGVRTYRNLLKYYNLEDKYEDINPGEKAKIIYLKKNKFGYEVLSYNSKYPKEFKDVEPDVDKMIEKFFTTKIEFLLEPCNKVNLLNENSLILDLFF